MLVFENPDLLELNDVEVPDEPVIKDVVPVAEVLVEPVVVDPVVPVIHDSVVSVIEDSVVPVIQDAVVPVAEAPVIVNGKRRVYRGSESGQASLT